MSKPDTCCTPLMCVGVCGSPSTPTSPSSPTLRWQHRSRCFRRSGGSVTIVDFKEATVAPCVLPLPADVGTLVVRTNESVASTGGLAVAPITRVQYEGGPSVIEVGGVRSRRNTPELDPGHILNVSFGGFENVAAFKNFFLFGFTSLTSVDLSPFSNVTSVGNGFMTRCSALTSIDITALRNVTTIGNQFLWCCSSLTSIDLKPLGNATSIGDNFMLGCTSLKVLSMSEPFPSSRSSPTSSWGTAPPSLLSTLVP